MHGVNDLYDAVQRAHEYQLLAEQVEAHACPLILTVGHVATKTVWGAVEPPGPSPAPSRMRRVSAARRDVLENFPTSVGRTDLEVALDECLASLRFPFVAAFSRTL